MSVADDLKNMSPDDVAALRRENRKQQKRDDRAISRELDAEERQLSTVPLPEILTLRERLKRDRPEVKWRITRLQKVGHRVLLAAQFKAGKTTLAANASRCLLDGDLFLGAYEVNAIDGALALFDFEMDDAQLDDWYADQDIQNDDRLVVFPMRGAASSFDITNKDVRAEWVAKLKSHRVAYLILDCLRPVLDALGLNEHTEAGLFLTALNELLREAGIPEALVIQHMGHKNERARGDSRLLDWPDVGWTLVREKDDDPASARFFKAYGRDVDVPEIQLAYNDTTRRLTVMDAAEGGVSRASARITAALTAICTFMDTVDGPHSRTNLENAVMLQGHARAAIRKALQEGVDTGVLIAEEGGRGGGFKYRSSAAGRPLWLTGNSASPPNSATTPPAELSNSASPPPPLGGGAAADLRGGG